MVESYFLEPKIVCLVRTPPTRIPRGRLNIQVYMVPVKNESAYDVISKDEGNYPLITGKIYLQFEAARDE